MEVPLLRWAGHSHQAVEGESNVLVFQGGVEEERGPSPQDGRGQYGVPLELLAPVAGENLVGGLAPYRVARLGEQCLVARPRALLPGELEVTLVLAVEVGLDDVLGDLGCHDAASGAMVRDLRATRVEETG